MVEGTCTLSTSSLNIIPIVLAGGKSSRMGRDKRFLFYENKSWLDHAIGVLQQTLGDDVTVFVSGEVNGYACIPDLEKDKGPLMGLYSVLHTLKYSDGRESWFLLLPVDMPKLSHDSLELLLPNARDWSEGIEIISFENQEMPLLIRNHFNVLEKVNSILDSTMSKRSFRNLINACKIKTVKKNSVYEFINFNSPGELESL